MPTYPMGAPKNLRGRCCPVKLICMSNRLRLYTEATDSPATYQVKWMTGLDKKGVLLVTVPTEQDDGKVAAELSAARWLLEQKNACGHDKTGAGLEIFVSSGAIKKLSRGGSSKTNLLRYAHFLRTRFIGADITVENREPEWADFLCEHPESLTGSEEVERLELRGFGPVEVTSHAIEKYAERFSRKITRSWREIRLLIQDPKLVEVRFQKRRARGKAPSQNTRYFYLPTRQLVFVVTASPSGESRLVTAYAPDEIRQLSLRVIRECEDRV